MQQGMCLMLLRFSFDFIHGDRGGFYLGERSTAADAQRACLACLVPSCTEERRTLHQAWDHVHRLRICLSVLLQTNLYVRQLSTSTQVVVSLLKT